MPIQLSCRALFCFLIKNQESERYISEGELKIIIIRVEREVCRRGGFRDFGKLFGDLMEAFSNKS